MPGARLMIQGTGSSVGKSVIVAGLARALTRRGLAVRPFKPQNMSNNAAVTDEGGEIGRAQALQARACGVAASVHMNPVLLKPQSEVGAQLVVQGAVRGNYRARDYQAIKPSLLAPVLDSFAVMQAQADIVLVEGAGSASETNLRTGDIANMGFARASRTNVVLLGDIDRGGVIASLVGTQVVLDPDDAALIKGFLVNRMRGDASLFEAGMQTIARLTGWRPLGLVPFLDAVRALPAEDAADLGRAPLSGAAGEALHVAVPMLPGIANRHRRRLPRLPPGRLDLPRAPRPGGTWPGRRQAARRRRGVARLGSLGPGRPPRRPRLDRRRPLPGHPPNPANRNPLRTRPRHRPSGRPAVGLILGLVWPRGLSACRRTCRRCCP